MIRRWFAILFGALILLCAIPVTYVETSCTASTVVERTPSRFVVQEDYYRRAQGDSFLTFPEWYIVHAYADLAGVTRQSSESAFNYVSSILGFWRSLCDTTNAAMRSGPVTLDQKITNYIIGISFTAELVVIGLYERTIGATTAWVRGATRTGEDAFALEAAENYAAFLRQTPWYEYPFGDQLRRFWRDTPWGQGNRVRGAERRFALTLQYGGKSLYAAALGALAGYSPADLRIMSVVSHLTPEDLTSEPRIKRLRDLDPETTLIETPRYREFTRILRIMAGRGVDVLEIAGNQRILVTILARENMIPGGTLTFSIPIQSRPGWRRFGLDVPVSGLTRLIRDVEQQGAEFEHAYDY